MASRMSLCNQQNFSSSFRAEESKLFRWVETDSRGHGRTGQVKIKSSRFERTISILGVELNRGSFIEFVNGMLKKSTSLNKPSCLEKGYVYGIVGGSSDEKIRDTFEKIMTLEKAKRLTLL